MRKLCYDCFGMGVKVVERVVSYYLQDVLLKDAGILNVAKLL